MKMPRFCLMIISLCCLLTGCGDWGGIVYRVEYPSGYGRDCSTWDDITPIEGSTLQLGYQKSDDYEKTRSYTLLLLDESGKTLYQYPNLGSTALRGVAGEEGSVWICSEQWSTPHFNGYRSGGLKGGTLLLAESGTGELLLQQTLERNELFLTAVGADCWFYAEGRPAEEKWFGLVKIPAENACIYTRNQAEWGQKTPVFQFGFVEWPEDLDIKGSVEETIRFEIEERQIQVVFTAYEQTDKQQNRWEHLEKRRVVIPLE